MEIKLFLEVSRSNLAVYMLFLSQICLSQVQFGEFKLIDANLDSTIRTFSDDFTHYLSEVDSLNIIAEPFSTNYTHVRFTSSDGHVQTEGVAPYAYRGDEGGDYGYVPGFTYYYGWKAQPGSLDFQVEYLINNVVQGTDYFTITFVEYMPDDSESIWVSDGTVTYYNLGNVGIGTDTPDSRLAVNGVIRAKEVKVETANWPDYVFSENYILPSIDEVEQHIQDNGHLINIPSALEIEKQGHELGEMNRLLLEKIEELTLYIIQLKIQNDQQQEDIDFLKKQIR